jgi:PAS domain S-box-containing protein
MKKKSGSQNKGYSDRTLGEVPAVPFQTLMDNIPGLIWSSDPDGSIDFLNKGWLSYTGLTQEQVLGTGWMQAIYFDDCAGTREKWTRAI